MAHNLNTVNGNVSFASTLENGNKKAWHGLGTYVKEPMNMNDALTLGGLDYEVLKTPLFLGDSLQSVNSHVATVRTDTNDVLGVVGKDYKVLQNKDAFDFFDIMSNGNIQIETVGALGLGERIFVTAKLPHRITVGNDDLTEMYLVLMNSHDGSSAVTVGISPVRVVCQNTLNHALGRLKNKISLKHTQSLQHRLNQAAEIMKLSLEYQIGLEEAYNFLFNTKVNDSVAKDLIRSIVQGNKNDSTRMDNILQKIEAIYNVGVGQDKIIGTAWGVFNAVTHYVSHDKGYQNEQTKFESLNKGDSSKIIQSAYDVLIDYAKFN